MTKRVIGILHNVTIRKGITLGVNKNKPEEDNIAAKITPGAAIISTANM